MIFITHFLFFLGSWEWLLVILVLILLFGAKKIPDLMKGLGRGVKEFKNASKEELAKEDGTKGNE